MHEVHQRYLISKTSIHNQAFKIWLSGQPEFIWSQSNATTNLCNSYLIYIVSFRFGSIRSYFYFSLLNWYLPVFMPTFRPILKIFRRLNCSLSYIITHLWKLLTLAMHYKYNKIRKPSKSRKHGNNSYTI